MTRFRSGWLQGAAAVASVLLGAGCLSVDLDRLLNPRLEEVTLREPQGWTGKRLLVVDISGLISSSPGGPFSIGTRCTPDGVRAVLDQARRDARIKAVLLRIDSPGGTVTATDMIAHEIQSFRQATHLPVHAMIMSAGCSGGYYIATSAERIWAHPSAVTGSIGVMAIFPQVQGLTGKIGIDEIVIKSGEMKDMGSSLRDMRPEERAVLQSMIDEFYGLFLDRVVAARPRFQTREALRPLADGRVFTAAQSVAAGLVDHVGYLDDAITGVLRVAGLRDARVVTYAYGPNDNATPYSRTAGASGVPASINVRLIDLQALAPDAGFHYLWMPGTPREG